MTKITMDKDKGSTIKNYQPNEKPILCSRDLEIHNPCREKHWEITIWLWAENRSQQEASVTH